MSKSARKTWWVVGMAGVILLILLVFDWNWLRAPLNQYVSQKTHRTFSSSDLHVRLGWTPTIRLKNVQFANAPWARGAQMARIARILDDEQTAADLVAYIGTLRGEPARLASASDASGPPRETGHAEP